MEKLNGTTTAVFVDCMHLDIHGPATAVFVYTAQQQQYFWSVFFAGTQPFAIRGVLFVEYFCLDTHGPRSAVLVIHFHFGDNFNLVRHLQAGKVLTLIT